MGLSVNGAGGPLFPRGRIGPPGGEVVSASNLVEAELHRCGASEIHSQGIAVHTAHRNVACATTALTFSDDRGVRHKLPPTNLAEEILGVAERGGPRRPKCFGPGLGQLVFLSGWMDWIEDEFSCLTG